jgi:protein SCO1/2
VCIAGITYDPGFDLPARLHHYGASRGLRFTSTVRLLRAVTGHDDLRGAFELRVGYTGSIVNRHAIELYLVDAAGGISRSWTRRQWDAGDVVSVLVGR